MRDPLDTVWTMLACFLTGGFGATVFAAYLLRRHGNEPELKTRRAGWTILLGAFLSATTAAYLLAAPWL